MDLINLITPVVAVVALFAAVALAVMFIRQGRALRRLEDQVATTGGSATRASLERIAELQSRVAPSSGAVPKAATERPEGRTWALAGGGVLGAVVVLAGGWFFFVRDSGGGTSAKATTTKTTSAPASLPTNDQIPANPAVLPNKAQYTIAVLNGSGIVGAAAENGVRVTNAGYSLGKVDNAPGVSGLERSLVMFPPGKRTIANNVGHDLGIKIAKRLDGLTADRVGNADAVIIVGRDLASGQTGGTSTTP